MFLSTYENRIDKKGRVSVPASFRSHLSNLGYNGVICYPSFNNQSIEACSQDRIEKLSSSIDSLNVSSGKALGCGPPATTIIFLDICFTNLLANEMLTPLFL